MMLWLVFIWLAISQMVNGLILDNLNQSIFKMHKHQDLRYEIICGHISIRVVEDFIHLSNCTVIEGDLHLSLSRIDTNHHHFPLLKEVTGHLIVYHLYGILTLERLFPNLAVIRGQNLITQYALIVKETPMKSLGLPSLRVIQRGGVYIGGNQQMCHLASISWNSVVADIGLVQTSGNRLICSDACPIGCPLRRLDDTDRHLCWSTTACQGICDKNCTDEGLTCYMTDTKRCCHSQCLGGCYGDGPSLCVSCKHLLHKGRCVENCPSGFYKFGERRCISAEDCFRHTTDSRDDYQETVSYAIDGKTCVPTCRYGYAKNVDGFCYSCHEDCPKKRCDTAVIYSLSDLKNIQHCYSVNGLYISIREGGERLMEELVRAFDELRVIECSLSVVRAQALVSLGFLRKLERIEGNCQNTGRSPSPSEERDTFEVIANENMRELWDYHSREKQLVISRGRVSFNMNRNLCASKILDVIDHGLNISNVPDEESRDFIRKSNGDLAPCNVSHINLTVVSTESRSVTLTWEEVDFRGMRGILHTLLMHKATKHNVSLLEDRAFCGADALSSWTTSEPLCRGHGKKRGTVWIPPSAFDESKHNRLCKLKYLRPATRYAVYVEIRSTLSNISGISDVIYFRTEPETPTAPTDLRAQTLSPNELKLSWKPPLEENGVVTKYLVWYRELSLDSKEFLMRDFCYHKPSWSLKYREGNGRDKGKSPGSTDSSTAMARRSWFMQQDGLNGTCSCEHCARACRRVKEDDKMRSDLFQFEDHIQNMIFIKRKEPDFMKRIPSMKRNATLGNYTTLTNRNTKASNKQSYRPPVSTSPSPRVKVTPSRDPLAALSLPTQLPLANLSGDRRWSDRQPIWVGQLELGADVRQHVFTNLKHFTEYVFEMVACQSPSSDRELEYLRIAIGRKLSDSDLVMTEEYNRRYCSPRSVISHRTLPNRMADNLQDDSLRAAPKTDGDVIIQWSAPLLPNGLVLYYRLRYQRVNNASQTGGWSSVCVAKQDWMKMSIDSPGSQSDVSEDGAQPGHRPKRDRRSPAGNDSSVRNRILSRIVGGAKLTSLQPGVYEYQLMTVSLAGNGSWTETKRFVIVDMDWTRQITIIVIVVVIVIFILLIGLLTAILVYCRIKSKREANTLVSPNPEYWAAFLADEWELDPEDICGIDAANQLGKGSFGMVFKGKLMRCTTPAKKYFPEGKPIEVAIKTLAKKNNLEDRRDFVEEASAMKELHCHHVVKLLGIVSRYGQMPGEGGLSSQPLVVMELMANGDLASYLRRTGDDYEEGIVEESRALLWAAQIADGMAYLARKKFVHRDLAARNCMVDANYTVKIGDFGLARDIYGRDYYRKQGRAKLPIRWMAPESIQAAYFTSQSDVWSYGVVLWEIVTLASLPYFGMSHEEVMDYVVNNRSHLGKNGWPDKCPPLLAYLMEWCWAYTLQERITFNDILLHLEPYTDTKFRQTSFFHNGLVDDDLLDEQFPIQDLPRDVTATTELELDSRAEEMVVLRQTLPPQVTARLRHGNSPSPPHINSIDNANHIGQIETDSQPMLDRDPNMI